MLPEASLRSSAGMGRESGRQVHAEEQELGRRAFTEALESIRTKHQVPGLAAAAYVNGQVVEIGAAGVRRADSEEKVSVDDRWHIGSCTKSMTASLAAILIQEEQMRWETTVGEIMKGTPGLAKRMARGHARATSPTPRRSSRAAPLTYYGRRHGNTPERLFSSAGILSSGLLRTSPEATPGTRFRYSNQGYSIAGAMIEQVTGRAWEDLMTENAFSAR